MLHCSFCRDLARSESGLLVAPAPESRYARYGPSSSFRPSIWVVAKVRQTPVNHSQFTTPFMPDWVVNLSKFAIVLQAGVLNISTKIREKFSQLNFRVAIEL